MKNLLHSYTPVKKSFWNRLIGKDDTGTIVEKAHAKINLYLHVIGKRNDGYHDLDTLIAFCNLHDTIAIRRAAQYTLITDSHFSSRMPDPKDNLITKIVHKVAEEVGEKPNLIVELKKNIPVAAGLGGGSADAAAVMRALSKLWNFSLEQINLEALLESVGSDVPVCLYEKPAFVQGRGEQITPAPNLPKSYIVLVNPNFPLEAKSVFQSLKIMPREHIPFFDSAPSTAEELVELLRNHQNDLMATASALEPNTLKVFRALSRAEGCLLPRLSGSGPTCFGIFKDKKSAALAAKTIRKDHPEWWVNATSFLGSAN